MSDRENSTTTTAMIDEAVEDAIEAASEYVSAMPQGERAWGHKEYKIAWTAAYEAIAAHRQKGETHPFDIMASDLLRTLDGYTASPSPNDPAGPTPPPARIRL